MYFSSFLPVDGVGWASCIHVFPIFWGSSSCLICVFNDVAQCSPLTDLGPRFSISYSFIVFYWNSKWTIFTHLPRNLLLRNNPLHWGQICCNLRFFSWSRSTIYFACIFHRQWFILSTNVVICLCNVSRISMTFTSVTYLHYIPIACEIWGSLRQTLMSLFHDPTGAKLLCSVVNPFGPWAVGSITMAIEDCPQQHDMVLRLHLWYRRSWTKAAIAIYYINAHT